MSVTLRTLYDTVKNQEKIRLVAGEKGLERVVRWIHMVEGTDISSFLEGDEVAFTTGIALGSMEQLYELAELNYKQNAAGMVINVGPYIEKIPQKIIDFGNEHDFPIFEVPWRVHMANIMREFSVLINLDEQKELEIISALKNAVIFSENENLYVPALLKYGYKREWSYCIATAEFYNKEGTLVRGEEKKRILRHARRYFRSWGQKAAVWELDDNIIFLFTNKGEEIAREELEKFWKEIKAFHFSDVSLYAGVGRATKSMHCIGKSFTQAEKIKNLQKKRQQKNTFRSYQQLGMYKLLLAMENTEVMQEYYQETLGKLEEYDHVNETDYLHFLKQYFDSGCSTQDVAAKLYIHRNSVTYKLHKIEEILGRSVSGQEDRMSLRIAFMIKEIITP